MPTNWAVSGQSGDLHLLTLVHYTQFLETPLGRIYVFPKLNVEYLTYLGEHSIH